MKKLTINLIDDLTFLLAAHPKDALRSLETSAPVLIDLLNQVREYALDYREVHAKLVDWLEHHPQPEQARLELLTIIED